MAWRLWGKEVGLVNMEVVQVAAVAAVAGTWVMADGYSRRARRRARQFQARQAKSMSEEPRRLLDAGTVAGPEE